MASIDDLLKQGRYLEALEEVVNELDGLVGRYKELADWARLVAFAACLYGQDCNKARTLLEKAGVKVEFLPPPLREIGKLPPDKALKVVEFVKRYSGEKAARNIAIFYVAQRIAAGTPPSELMWFAEKAGIADVLREVNRKVAELLTRIFTGKTVTTKEIVDVANKIDELLENGRIEDAVRLLPRLESLTRSYIEALRIAGVDEKYIEAVKRAPAVALLNIALSTIFGVVNGQITQDEARRILSQVKSYAVRMGLGDVANAIDMLLRTRPDITSVIRLLEKLTGRKPEIRVVRG